jgi:TetR/AcrR family transcriptional regulator
MAVSSARMSASDRRNQLLDVAIDLFSRKGFGGTTTREIATAAGVTEAIIFRHFATKQDLYKAILDSRCGKPDAQSWFSEMRQFMENNDDAGLFRCLISMIIRANREDPRFERLLIHAALEGHELAIMMHNQFAQPIGMQLIEYVERRQREGALRPCNPKAVIFAVAGVSHYYATQKYLYQCANIPMPDDEIAEAFLGIIMNGLRITTPKRVK